MKLRHYCQKVCFHLREKEINKDELYSRLTKHATKAHCGWFVTLPVGFIAATVLSFFTGLIKSVLLKQSLGTTLCSHFL